ncbi:MAG: RNA polymerase sigma factor [Burkholderiaceae bacterium]
MLDANEHVNEQHRLRSAWSGDERAFTALYRRHEAAVYRFALLLTGSATQAADVTQDVFVELLSASNGYDPARGSLAAYLCGIARFRAYRAMDSRLQSVDDFDAQTEVHTAYDAPAMPCERLERSRALQMLYGAIHKLPPIFRDVLILVELQEMSYADTAAIAGIELGTVRSRLSRAKARLAQLLNEQSE